MGPNFLSVLALFSARGREMAHNAVPRDEIQRRQRELAAKTAAIAEAVPDLIA